MKTPLPPQGSKAPTQPGVHAAGNAAQPRVWRGLWAVYLSSLASLCGIFMLMPWQVLTLKQAGASSTATGLFAACGWLGILLVAPLSTRIVHRLGERTSLLLAGGVPVLTTLGFAFTRDLPTWVVLELLASMSGGLRWVLAEALVAQLAPPHLQGRCIALYSTLVGATMALGPALLSLIGPEHPLAIWVAWALVLLGLLLSLAVPLKSRHTARAEPSPEDSAHGLRALWLAARRYPAVALAGMVGGYFELGLAPTLPPYALWLGISAADAALLVAIGGAGGTLLALPAGWLADRGREPVRRRLRMMQGCTTVLALASACAVAVPLWPGLIWVLALLWGSLGGVLYTLTMVDIGAREQGLALVSATSVLVLAYTVGGLVSSATGGLLLDWSPQWALPAVLCALALAATAALRGVRR